MHGPDGTDYRNRIEFIEVVRPERLVYRHTGDEDADPTRFHTTVTFAERNGTTELTKRAVFESNEARDFVIKTHQALEGGKQTIGRLADYVATLRGRGR